MGTKSGITSIGKLREPFPADEEARKRLGDYFVAVLLLDQGGQGRCPGPEYLNRCEVCAER